MKRFKFATNKKIIEKVVKDAKRFIYIVSFQFTADSFIRKLLLNKAKSIELSIITLPIDSYKDAVERDKIDKLYKDLEKNGAKVYQCMWEVGDPSLTATSLSGEQLEGGGNKWYSMHGKFVVTDKDALMMSSNFTDEEEIEAYLLISDKDVIKQFVEKFNQLRILFIDYSKVYPGRIFDLADNETKNYIKKYNMKTNSIKSPLWLQAQSSKMLLLIKSAHIIVVPQRFRPSLSWADTHSREDTAAPSDISPAAATAVTISANLRTFPAP